jgi:hypothetical protein
MYSTLESETYFDSGYILMLILSYRYVDHLLNGSILIETGAVVYDCHVDAEFESVVLRR